MRHAAVSFTLTLALAAAAAGETFPKAAGEAERDRAVTEVRDVLRESPERFSVLLR